MPALLYDRIHLVVPHNTDPENLDALLTFIVDMTDGVSFSSPHPPPAFWGRFQSDPPEPNIIIFFDIDRAKRVDVDRLCTLLKLGLQAGLGQKEIWITRTDVQRFVTGYYRSAPPT